MARNTICSGKCALRTLDLEVLRNLSNYFERKTAGIETSFDIAFGRLPAIEKVCSEDFSPLKEERSVRNCEP